MWTLAGDINTTVSTIERPSGGQDARRHFSRFLHHSEGQDLWALNPDRTRDHDWTCRARGSTGSGNIIDRIVLSNKGFGDAEIRVADKSSDYVPMTDHRAVVGFMNILPLNDPIFSTAHIKFSRDTQAGCGKPRLRYPQGTEKKKFEDYRLMVDEKIKDKSLHKLPVNDDDSFIIRYNALTQIFKECGDATFGRVKRIKNMFNQRVTSPRIQRIQSDIKHLGRALRMTQSSFSGEVSHTSIEIFQRHHLKYLKQPGDFTDFRSYLLAQRRMLYKMLYNERMSEIYSRAQTADKKWVTGTLIGGSAKRLMSMGDYMGMPITLLTSANGDTLVTDPDLVKTTTKEYWSKLYK